MTTTVTKTIKTSGGDYSSLSAWEAANQADLVATDTISQAECYAGSYTGSLTIAGWTTGAANYIRVYTPTAERHNGISRDTSGIGFQIVNTSTVINVQEEYVTFEGLEIKCSQATAGVNAVLCSTALAAGANQVLFRECIIKSITTALTVAVVDMTGVNLNGILRNCIVYNNQGTGSRGIDCRGSSTCEISHCTVSVTGDYGIRHGAELTCKNTYVCGATTQCFDTSGASGSGSNNASSDATATTDYTSSLINKAASSQFVSVTVDSEDYHLKSGNALDGFGTPLAAVPLDIDGGTRSLTAPAIGADETTPTLSLVTASDAPAQSIADASTLVPYLFLQTDGDLSAGSWTTELDGTTNLYQSIDEFDAVDTDFIRSEAFPVASVASFSLTDPSLAAGTGAGVMRIRYYKESAERVNLIVRLKQGVTVIKTWTYSDIDFAVLQVEEALTAGEVATITDANALTVEFEASWTP